MGTTTNAILIYGAKLDNAIAYEPLNEAEENVPYERLAKESSIFIVRWMLHTLKEYDGCAFKMHCSAEYPEYILYPVALEPIVAFRGYPKSVNIMQLVVKSNNTRKEPYGTVERFINKYSLDVTDGIGWNLCSYWG